jgi:hypothetical protein
MKSIRFYAVDSDWIPVFEYLESKHAVSYTSLGDIYRASAKRYEFGRILPNLGVAAGEQTVLSDHYLIAHMETPILVQKGTQWDGRERFDIYQTNNVDSIRLFPAGRWKDMIIEGLIDTMSDSEKAQALMRAFSNPMRKHFKRVSARWVGPQAYREWQQGRRLTGAEQSPSEYDLREGQS